MSDILWIEWKRQCRHVVHDRRNPIVNVIQLARAGESGDVVAGRIADGRGLAAALALAQQALEVAPASLPAMMQPFIRAIASCC